VTRETDPGNRGRKPVAAVLGSGQAAPDGEGNASPFGVAPNDSTRPLGRCGHGNAGRIKGRIGPGRGSLRQGRCSIRFERTADGTTTRRLSGLRVRVFGPGTVEGPSTGYRSSRKVRAAARSVVSIDG